MQANIFELSLFFVSLQKKSVCYEYGWMYTSKYTFTTFMFHLRHFRLAAKIYEQSRKS